MCRPLLPSLAIGDIADHEKMSKQLLSRIG
jgi:hypothetical protein